ncbi:MAG: hypothetical protein PHX74_02920 [Candidatus Sumerlaeales bacterium]|nr:hypothetical protein [Candidatus Sumerlaeales bacterium]
MRTETRQAKPRILQREKSRISRLQPTVPYRIARNRKPSLTGFDMLCYLVLAVAIIALGSIQIGLRHTTVDYKAQVQKMITTSKMEKEQLMALMAEEASKLSLTAIMENASYHGLVEPAKTNIVQAKSYTGYDAAEDKALRKEFGSGKYSNPNEDTGMRGILLKIADFAQSASAANHRNDDGSAHFDKSDFTEKKGTGIEKTQP